MIFSLDPGSKVCECGCGLPVKNRFVHGHNKGRKGQVHSKEWKDNHSQKMSGRVISEEHKKRISTSLKGRVNGPRLQEVKERISNSLQGHKDSLETRSKKSKSAKNSYSTGDRVVPFTNVYGTSTIYNGVQMRSKLEARVAFILDSNDIEWQYEKKRFYLKELQKTYIPDFYLPEFNIYLEAKGMDWGLDKVEALRQQGQCVVLVRERDL